MKPKRAIPEDPLISEVRRRRTQLLKRFDFSLVRLGRYIRKLESKHPDKIVSRQDRTSPTHRKR